MARETWSMAQAAGLAACDGVEVEGAAAKEASDELAAEEVEEAAPLAAARDTAITYVRAWSREGARREGGGYVFESDLGDTIGITARSAVSTIARAPCVDGGGPAEDGGVGGLAA
jgi:hypothetical protein